MSSAEDRFESVFAALLSLGSAAVALTCAAQQSFVELNPGPAEASTETHPSAKGRTELLPNETSGAPTPLARAPNEAGQTSQGAEWAGELTRFRRALEALENGERGDSVRILWLGDSHTAADYMTGAVRRVLWDHYDPGGPGFLRLGVLQYRHDQAILNRVGRFRVEPEPPSRRVLQDDGVFGLGGMRATPLADGAEMTVKISRGALRGKASHTILFDLPESAAFEVSLGDQLVRVPRDQAGRQVPESPISRLDLQGEPDDVLKLRRAQGRPRFYGVIVEGSEPGVVLDTAGIDGARLATALAWAEKAFVAEVTARRPDLVVLAYGTNEVFDGLGVQAYARELFAVLERLRSGAPSADCLVLGPPDAMDPTANSLPRVAEIGAVYEATAREVGCAFLSAQKLMGGSGAFLEWLRQTPPLARADRVHLAPLGYRALGSRIGAELLGKAAEPEGFLPKNSP